MPKKPAPAPAPAPKRDKEGRNAINGQFVTDNYVQKNPNTTEMETIIRKPSTPKKKKDE